MVTIKHIRLNDALPFLMMHFETKFFTKFQLYSGGHYLDDLESKELELDL